MGGSASVRGMMVKLGSVRRLRRLTVAFGLGLALGCGVAEARIGDTPEQMAARLLQPNLGKTFSWPKDLRPQEKERQQKENPLFNFANLLPTSAEDWREQIFWKSALHRQLSDDDGWRVHVYYLKGRSVVELYRRVGAPLNDFEISAILGRMRGNQTWRRVPKKGNASESKKDASTDTILGYDFELGDEGAEVMRARREGDWLIVFHKRFDDYLAARKARWEENETQRKAEQAVVQEKLAPVSVDGF